jgi:hypothetical protein
MLDLLKKFLRALAGTATCVPTVCLEIGGREGRLPVWQPGPLPFLRVSGVGAGSLTSRCLFFPKGKEALPCSHIGRIL